MRVLIALISLSLSLPIWAQDVYFINPNEEQPDLTATAVDMVQDHIGFIWIATTDGLKRYDGTQVVEYRKIPGDTTSLSNNDIRSLFLGSSGDLWIGTRNGANLYNREKDNFFTYYPGTQERTNESNYILDIHEDMDQNIWISTYQGRHKIADLHSKSTVFLTPIGDEYNNEYSPITWSYYKDSYGRLWMGNQGWISFTGPEDTTGFTKIFPNGETSINNLSTQYWAFAESPDNTLWVGSDDGIFVASLLQDTVQFEKLTFTGSIGEGLNQAFINHIGFHNDDREVFVSTYSQGLYIIRLDQNYYPKSVTHHMPNQGREGFLRYHEVNMTMQDASGVSWVATKTGLNKISPEKSKFQSMGLLSSVPLSSPIVKAIEMDDHGNLWIGTVNGLNRLDAQDLRNHNYVFDHYYHTANDEQSISHNNIFDIFIDVDSTLFVCTRHGISYAKINHKSKKLRFERITRADGLPHDWVYGMAPLSEDEYWVNTYGGFLRMKLNEKGKLEILNLESADDEGNQGIVNATSYITERDAEKSFWIGTFAGLSEVTLGRSGGTQFYNYKYDPNDLDGISDNSIIDIHQDQESRIWIGTRNGLNLVQRNLNESEVTFKHYGIQDGFVNDVIQSIEEDDSGNLWLGTNQGIIQFSKDGSGVKNFTQKDEVSGPGQVFRASFRAPDGTMFFGSPSGINLFHPDSIAQRTFPASVMISDIEVMGRSLFQLPETKFLNGTLHEAEQLKLRHTDKMLKVFFASNDFSRPTNNHYRYRLVGFDDEWILTNGDNYATFTNLNTGRYTLEIQSTNSDQMWSPNIRRLSIIVIPPWWKTTWAYMLLGLFLGSLLYVIYRLRLETELKQVRQEAKLEVIRNQEREAMRKRNAADYHDELGHRLTKISLLIDMAQNERKSDDQVSSFFPKLRANVHALSDGVKDLIWSIDPEKDSLIETIFRLQEFGDQLFDMSNIQFKTSRIDKTLQGISMNATNRKNLLLIFKEAMNNSLKYSCAQVAELNVSKNGEGIYVRFLDDGKGFEKQSVQTGYGLRSMHERARRLNGSLTIRNNEPHGTIVSLHLPLKS